jgi:hypothetical protein
MQGNKTHEQFQRTVERKDDVAKTTETDRVRSGASEPSQQPQREETRQSEFSVSRGGMHQESRDHNKHNNPGQEGHKPQQHSPAEEKH